MFSFSFVILFFLVLGFAYYYIMKWYNLKNKEEVEEKLEEIKQTDELAKTVKKVNATKYKKAKDEVEKFRKL